MFLAALDQNIVGTAIKTIADELHGLSAQAWVTTAYPHHLDDRDPALRGSSPDIYGRKKFFMAAITIFILGSAMCLRGSILPAGRLPRDPGHRRRRPVRLRWPSSATSSPAGAGQVPGLLLAVFGTSSVLGPIIGGFFAQADSILGITGWRWVFLVNVPVGLVALLIVALHAASPTSHARFRAIDWWGAFTWSSAWSRCCSSPSRAVSGAGRPPRRSPRMPWALVGLVAFVWVETRMGEAALIPMRIFRNRTIAIAPAAGRHRVRDVRRHARHPALPADRPRATPMTSGFQMLPMVLG